MTRVNSMFCNAYQKVVHIVVSQEAMGGGGDRLSHWSLFCMKTLNFAKRNFFKNESIPIRFTL